MSKDGTGVQLTDEELKIEEEIAKSWAELPDDVFERRQALKNLLPRGLSIASLAKVLNCSSRTISRDIQWLEKLSENYLDRYVQTKEIGETINLLADLENKSLILLEQAMQDIERWIEVPDKSGGMQWIEANLGPNHLAANRHIRAVAELRSKRHMILNRVGLMKVIPERNIGGAVDIAKLSTEDALRLQSELKHSIIETAERISRYHGFNPLEGADKNWEN